MGQPRGWGTMGERTGAWSVPGMVGSMVPAFQIHAHGLRHLPPRALEDSRTFQSPLFPEANVRGFLCLAWTLLRFSGFWFWFLTPL